MFNEVPERTAEIGREIGSRQALNYRALRRKWPNSVARICRKGLNFRVYEMHCLGHEIGHLQESRFNSGCCLRLKLREVRHIRGIHQLKEYLLYEPEIAGIVPGDDDGALRLAVGAHNFRTPDTGYEPPHDERQILAGIGFGGSRSADLDHIHGLDQGIYSI